MLRIRPTLAILALLFAASQAFAEYRAILVEVKQEKGKATVSIYSDNSQDRRTAVSVDEALKAIGGMKGWGSAVGVFIATDKGVKEEELKRLHAAVKGNIWLDLTQASGEVPKHLRDYFLKDRKQ